jgi:hypothetical protein
MGSTFEDIIGAEDIFGAAGDIAFGYGSGYTQGSGATEREMQILLAGEVPIVGAAGGADPQRRANKMAMLRQLAARHAAAVVPRPVTKSREYPVGFPTTTIPAGATVSIFLQPQVPFRGRRLIVPSDIAGALLINDLKVGKNSQFATSGPVPARVYSEFGVGVDMNLDTAQISQQISLNVTNTSGAAVTFNAALLGTAVE